MYAWRCCSKCKKFSYQQMKLNVKQEEGGHRCITATYICLICRHEEEEPFSRTYNFNNEEKNARQ